MLHAPSFCRTDEEISLYQKLITSDTSPDEIFADYTDSETGAKGTGAVTARILSREYSGRLNGGFHFYKPTKKEAETFHLPETGYVMLLPKDGADYTNEDVTIQEFIPVYTICTALKLPRFGACYTTRLVKKQKKTEQYETKLYHLEF